MLVLFLFVAAAVVVGMLVCFVIRVFGVFRCLGFRLLKGLGASESDLQMLKDLGGSDSTPKICSSLSANTTTPETATPQSFQDLPGGPDLNSHTRSFNEVQNRSCIEAPLNVRASWRDSLRVLGFRVFWSHMSEVSSKAL